MYLHENDYNIGQVNDPITFVEGISCLERGTWLAAMKKELKLMQDNEVRDPVDLPIIISQLIVIGCIKLHGVLKGKMTSSRDVCCLRFQDVREWILI